MSVLAKQIEATERSYDAAMSGLLRFPVEITAEDRLRGALIEVLHWLDQNNPIEAAARAKRALAESVKP